MALFILMGMFLVFKCGINFKIGTGMHPAFVLHYRPYRETSLLLDCLTNEAGRVSLIARGAKRPKSSQRGLLQPFAPLWIDWRGKGDLPTLSMAESRGRALMLFGSALLSGFYINELLMRVLHKHDPCDKIFQAYETTLQLLSEKFQESTLRKFERVVLQELGYGLHLLEEAVTHQAIHPLKAYYYEVERGCIEKTSAIQPYTQAMLFQGIELINIMQDCYEDKATLDAAKRLMRLAYAPLLGSKPLKSRELFLKI
jgi:DNA repair protein RecO (recombination protein O)